MYCYILLDNFVDMSKSTPSTQNIIQQKRSEI